MSPKHLNLTEDQLLAQLGLIHDAFRNACLSRNYYARRLSNFKVLNTFYEIILAIGTSTTVAAWTYWNVPGDKNFWTIFAGIIAVLAIIKPFLPLSREIERFSNLHTGYSDLFYDLKRLVDDIKVAKCITKEFVETYKNTDKRYKALALKDDPRHRKRLKAKCEEEVRKAFPRNYLWNPRAKALHSKGEKND